VLGCSAHGIFLSTLKLLYSSSVVFWLIDGTARAFMKLSASTKWSNGVFFVFQILVETGHIGRQASASVMVTDGETASRQNLVST